MEREKKNLVRAIAAGGHLNDLVEALQERDTRLARLTEERELERTQSARQIDARRARQELLALAQSWRQVLTQEPLHARPILADLLVGRVTFTPAAEPKRWELRGRGTLSGLFDAILPLGMASLTVPSWNRLRGWLQEMDLLRKAA